jgi:hypothetical protein
VPSRPDLGECRTGGRDDALLEDFLDHLCAPLVGVLPFEQRASLRQEVRCHLECLAEELAESGLPPDAALRKALREFGEPWAVGESLLKEVRGEPEGSKVPLLHTAAARGLVWFGIPSAACLWLLTEGALAYGQQHLLGWAVGLALATPWAAGILTGLTAPADAESGAARAVGAVALVSLGAGLLLLPQPEGLYLALLQLAYWLPMGWVAARCTAFSVRQYRRFHFLPPERRAGRAFRRVLKGATK